MPGEYDCRLCGGEFATMDGLLNHIPSHTLTQAQYGTLVATAEDTAAHLATLEAVVEAADRMAQAIREHAPCDSRGINDAAAAYRAARAAASAGEEAEHASR